MFIDLTPILSTFSLCLITALRSFIPYGNNVSMFNGQSWMIIENWPIEAWKKFRMVKKKSERSKSRMKKKKRNWIEIEFFLQWNLNSRSSIFHSPSLFLSLYFSFCKKNDAGIWASIFMIGLSFSNKQFRSFAFNFCLMPSSSYHLLWSSYLPQFYFSHISQ